MGISYRHYRSLLLRYLRPHRLGVSALAVLLFGNIGLQLVNPQIMRRFVDAAQAGAATEALLRVAVIFTGVAFAQQLVSLLATYVSENVGWAVTNTLRAQVAEHCLRLDMSFHNAHTPGEMIERIDGDVTAVTNLFTQFVIQVVGNALLLVGVLALLFREDWRLGAALSLFCAGTLGVLWRLRDIAEPHWQAERQASADLFGFLEERLAGTEDIRASGAKLYVLRRFIGLLRELMRRSVRAGLMVNVMVNSSWLLFAAGSAVALALGAYLYLVGRATIGTVFMIGWYGNMLMWPIQTITDQMQELQRAAAGIARIQELLGLQSRIREAEVEMGPLPALPKGPLAVAFEGVSFAYGDPPAGDARRGDGEQGAAGPAAGDVVLREVSFRLGPGTVLGLLGRTGSGKTTLIRLIFRLYDPVAGRVCLGDGTTLTDIRCLPLAHLGQRVGMVTQEIQLFNATVRDNLTFFDDRITDGRILEVIRDLGLWPWYESLLQGLDTELESGGGGLSAGEAQLLAFTRIFLQDPGVVILDEASSRLDPATEEMIERAVSKLVRGRTAIIIAHRLRTVERAHAIMILEQGEICEYGPRAALAADPGSRFYGLLQTGLQEVLA